MEEKRQDDLPTLVRSLQAATEWLAPLQRLTNSSMTSSVMRNVGSDGHSLRYMQVLEEIEEMFADIRMKPSALLVTWCASLEPSGIATPFSALLVDHILQGILPYVALQRCLRLVDIFLGWATRPNAGSAGLGIDNKNHSCPVLVPSHALVKWLQRTWTAITNLSRDNVGSTSPTSTASLCGALQLVIILLRWNVAESPLPPFRRVQLPHPVHMVSVEARLWALQVLPSVLRHQTDPHVIQACSVEMIEYVKRACGKAVDLSVRIASGSSLRGLLEAGLRVSSPAVAYTFMDMLLALCDDASLHNVPDEELHDVGVSMGYLLAFYQCDFTVDALVDVMQALTAPIPKYVGAERIGHRSVGGGNRCRVRWNFLGGSDVAEGSRVVQRSFNQRMTRTTQRTLAKALATMCACCTSPATTADALQCCFVLLVPLAGDVRAYMPRLLADAVTEWAAQLPSNAHRLVLADALRRYIQRPDEDKAVVRTAMVALKGVMRTLTSSLEIGFNVAQDVLAAVQATPALLHTGVEVLAAVARTNVLYARHLQHECVQTDWVKKANTATAQLHIQALLEAACSPRVGRELQEDGLDEENRVSLVHLCTQLLLRFRDGDHPFVVQDIHYRQAELVFRLTWLLYDLLHGSSAAVLAAIRDEVQPCAMRFMSLLVSSPATSIAFDKAATAACAMLQRAPVVSDTERMLAIGFLEARLTSQCNSAMLDASLSAPAAGTAYFAVSRSSLFELVYSKPWPTCSDDDSLCWLAAQALKDVATACARGVPVFSFADVFGATISSAAKSMGLLHADFSQSTTSEESSDANPRVVDDASQTVEECGSKAVRLRRWTLHHFMERRGVSDICVALLTSLRTNLYDVYGTPGNDAALESAEESPWWVRQRNVALWNCLCSVEELLQEALLCTAKELWQCSGWLAEVKWWQALATQLVPATSRTSVEVRLLAARVIGRCLVAADQVDSYTSQTVSAAAQALADKSAQCDVTGALVVLIEAHSCYGRSSSTGVSAATADGSNASTLPLVTSLLAEAWKQLANSALTTVINTATVPVPLLMIASLRLAGVYPEEVEAALLDHIVAVLLAPMTTVNCLWWSPGYVLGIFTALQQLWALFPGCCSSVSAVQHGTALALWQQAHMSAMEGTCTATPSAAAAALDALRMYTMKHYRGREQVTLAGTRQRCGCWHVLLHQSLDHMTLLMRPAEASAATSATTSVRRQTAALRRHVVRDDNISTRLATLWRMATEGVTDAVPSAAHGCVRMLSLVDILAQVDVATAAATRKEWMLLAESLYTSLPSQRGLSTPLGNREANVSLKIYLDGIRTVLQTRPPDVQLGIAERDTALPVAEAEMDAPDSMRSGGGGIGDSDAIQEYAEEYSKEGVKGILHETAGVDSASWKHGSTSADLMTGGGRSAGVPLTFDVAAKEAAMWLLYGVLRSINRPCSDTNTRCEVSEDEDRDALLPVVVAAAQLVEVHPEVQISIIAVLREVLAVWGDAAHRQGHNSHGPVLLQWKTQLVVGLTTVLQHGILSLEGCTALAVQYSRCNMADQSSCCRVLRSLMLLLHACQRLDERGRGFLLVGGCGAGHIIVALTKVAQAPAMNPASSDSCGSDGAPKASVEKTQRNILRSLALPACQAALTLQCELLLTAASLANGHMQSADTIGLVWSETGGGRDSDDDSDNASPTPRLYAPRMLLTAGDVLQAVSFITQEPAKAPLGPALRYSSGCLAVLVVSTIALSATSPPLHDVCPPSSASALASVVILSPHLSANHQRLLAQLAQERLCARMEKRVPAAQLLHSAWGTTDTGLLRLAALAPLSGDAATRLLECITPLLSHSTATGDWKAQVSASLLCVGMTVPVEPSLLLPLLKALSVQSLLSELPQEVLNQLHKEVCSYVRVDWPTRALLLALASPAGLLLVEQSALSDDSSAVYPPLLAHQATWPVVLQLLQEAPNPLHAVTAMWSGTSFLEQKTPPSPRMLRYQVSRHRFRAELILSILASIGNLSVSNSNSQEAVAHVLLRCGDLMSELLLGIIAPAEGDAVAPCLDALYTALAYVVEVLCTPLSVAYSVAMRPVGVHLVRTVAVSAGPTLREAIQRLGSTKAVQLRTFMEQSCA